MITLGAAEHKQVHIFICVNPGFTGIERYASKGTIERLDQRYGFLHCLRVDEPARPRRRMARQ